MPEDYLKDSEEVGIKGCLIENSLAEPISGSDPLPPLVVCPAIAGEIIEKRDRIDFNQVEQTDEKCAAENDPKPNRIRRQRNFCSSARLLRAAFVLAIACQLCELPSCAIAVISVIDRARPETVCRIELSPFLPSR